MKKIDLFCIIGIIIIVAAVAGWTVILHLTTQTEKLESLQANVKNIEKRLDTLTNQVSYQKAFLNKTIATAITDRLMVEFDGTKEVKSFRNSIPLQDLLDLIIKRLDLKIIKVPATDGGYELESTVKNVGALNEKSLK